MKPDPQVLLASKSPRRRELLQQIGVCFDVVSVDVPEELQAGEQADAYVARLAESKSRAGFIACDEKLPVLGADTIVVHDNKILEKPQDEEDCVRMLSLLSGTEHIVKTGIALSTALGVKTKVVDTKVCFARLTERQMRAYWASGEPCDKAGAYGIQGLGAVFVEKIQGCYSNVVGLPLHETSKLLANADIAMWVQENDT